MGEKVITLTDGLGTQKNCILENDVNIIAPDDGDIVADKRALGSQSVFSFGVGFLLTFVCLLIFILYISFILILQYFVQIMLS